MIKINIIKKVHVLITAFLSFLFVACGFSSLSASENSEKGGLQHHSYAGHHSYPEHYSYAGHHSYPEHHSYAEYHSYPEHHSYAEY
ncbi:MAG: DUF166 domain-containing protein, partial [Alphaproteobacteria bacterium]|nr:DUF166 domain-containing protein [Alphaproteobacteria bacterium]